jgi:hypothetical protein
MLVPGCGAMLVSVLKTSKGKAKMSLSLAIAINGLLDVALIAVLAHAMSRPARLTSHVPSAE